MSYSDDDWYEVMKFVGFGGEFGALLLLILMDKKMFSVFFRSVFKNCYHTAYLIFLSNSPDTLTTLSCMRLMNLMIDLYVF